MTGDILRRERERQKLTIQDIEQGTSIRAVYIEALEKGDYDKLPGEVYAKGFVKNYANFLNLDAEKLSKEFTSEIAPAVVEVAEGEVAFEDNKIEETPASNFPKSGKTKITELKEPNMKIKHSGNNSSNMFVIAAVVIIALFAGGAWYYLKNNSDTVANVNPPQSAEVEQQQPAENPVTNPVENPVSAAGLQDGVNIQATFSGNCWTRVYVDGAFAYEGIPNAGQVFDWHGVQFVTIRAGNAGAIDITMNGQPIGKLGNEGEVLERTFTK